MSDIVITVDTVEDILAEWSDETFPTNVSVLSPFDVKQEKKKEEKEEETEQEEEEVTYYVYGVLLIVGACAYFIFGLGSMFKLWIFPTDSEDDFPVDNYYVYVIYLSPTIFWIWSIVSWVGMKLFRQAKGNRIPN